MKANRKAKSPQRTGQGRFSGLKPIREAAKPLDTHPDRVSQLEETAPERWEYVVYRDGKRVRVTREEYEARYHPGSEDQV